MKIEMCVRWLAAVGLVVAAACSSEPPASCEDSGVSCGPGGTVKACQQNDKAGNCSMLYYQTPDGAQFPCNSCPTSKDQVAALCDAAAIKAVLHCATGSADAGLGDAGTVSPDSGTASPDSGTAGGCPRACAKGFTCVAGACVLDTKATWTIKVTNGGVGPKTTNIGSDPDPKVCLTLGGIEQCTPEQTDTRAPTWNFTFTGAPTTSTLVTGISFRYIDVDIGFDDLICSGTLALSAADFSSGSFKRVCAADTASYFAGTVTPR